MIYVEVISNASANIMEFAYTDKNRQVRKKIFIQIGTVMTKAEFRGKGYAGKLIQKIVEDYQEKCDGFYLFGNLSAISFYKKIGFVEGLQMFYTGGYKNVYYSEKLDCYISYGVKDGTLYLQSVVSEKQIDVCDVLKTFQMSSKRLNWDFTTGWEKLFI